MARQVKLSHLNDVLAEFDYPISHDEAKAGTEDVELQLADGTANMGEVLAESDADEFSSAEELSNELMNHLPRRAVGEPYQSEGDA